MSSVRKKNMGVTMIALSALFFFNPIVAFLDVLPDCIGFLLLCNGLSLLADIDEHLTSAQKNARILFGTGILQLLAQVMVYGYLPSRSAEMNPYEAPVTVLLLSFILSVLYCVLLIPTFKNLFLGIERLQERFSALEQTSSRKRSSAGERLYRLSVVFVITNALASLLPELSILTSFEHDAMGQLVLFGWVEKLQFTFDWYDYVGLFRVLAFFIALAISVVWLVRFLAYFLRLQRDKQWIGRLQAHYAAEILPQTDLLATRRFRYSFLILSVGILFSVSLRMNYFSFLPGFVFAFLTFAALSTLGELLQRPRKCYVACAVLGGCSILEMLVNFFYLKRYFPQDSLYNANAFWHYLAVQILGALEAIATLIVIYYLFLSLYELVQKYTGVRYREGGEEALSSKATQTLHRSFYVRLHVAFLFFFISCAGAVADSLFHLSMGWMWLIPLCASVAGLVCFYTIRHDLLEEIEYHFKEEKRSE